MVSCLNDMLVTLTVTNQALPFPERHFIFTEAENTICIGRASKTQAKGRVASQNNGLFDSPVMSRMHAELRADIGARTLSIKDVGSTHGTFVNGALIPKDGSYEIKADDKLTFGIAINREHDAFIPVVVNLTIEFAERRRPLTFTVPDASDSEVESETMPSNHVDLTDDTEIVDLTSPPNSPCPAAQEVPTCAELNPGTDSLGILDGAPKPDSGPRPVVSDDDASSIWPTDEENLEFDDQSDNSAELESEGDGCSDDGLLDLDSDAESDGSGSVHDLFLFDDGDSDDVSQDGKDNGYLPLSFSPLLSAGAVTTTSGNVPSNPVQMREPSPSDAALCIRKPLRPASDPAHTREEFFAARENNKVAASSIAIPGWSGMRSSNSVCAFTTTFRTDVGPKPQPALFSLGSASPGPVAALDQELTGDTTGTTAKIDAPQQQATSLKRKAAEISNEAPEEVAAVVDKELSDATKQPAPTDSAIKEDSPPLAPTALDGSRPIKKLRRIASRIGIAAFSGITVGAVVFGSLAATCPDF